MGLLLLVRLQPALLFSNPKIVCIMKIEIFTKSGIDNAELLNQIGLIKSRTMDACEAEFKVGKAFAALKKAGASQTEICETYSFNKSTVSIYIWTAKQEQAKKAEYLRQELRQFSAAGFKRWVLDGEQEEKEPSTAIRVSVPKALCGVGGSASVTPGQPVSLPENAVVLAAVLKACRAILQAAGQEAPAMPVAQAVEAA
jgi:hypothetical protein